MERTDLGRIVAFTDAVMAVAITLLVLNLEVPDVPRSELEDALVDLLPSLLAYALAFALVGRFWVIHHRLFETLRGFDSTLMVVNLAFLALIVLIPFAAELYDSFTREPLAGAVFGAVMGLAALAHWSMTAHALRRGFVHEEHREATRPFGGIAALGFTALFLLSIPVAFASTTLAALMWTATIVLRYPLRGITGRRP